MKKKTNNYEMDNIFPNFFNKNTSSMKISLYPKIRLKKLIDDHLHCLIKKFNLKRSNILGINRINDVVNVFNKIAYLKYLVESNFRRFCCIE